jgi:hypothetical protein
VSLGTNHLPSDPVSRSRRVDAWDLFCHNTDMLAAVFVVQITNRLSGTGNNSKNLTDTVVVAVYFTVIYCDLK